MKNQLHVKMAVAHSYFRRCVMESSAFAGLLPGQPKVLEYLATHPGCTPKDIGTAWNSDKATLSGIISRMERDGLLTVSVSADDRRKKTLAITVKGQQIYNTLQSMLNLLNATAIKDISDEEMSVFLSVLEKIQLNIKDFHPSANEIIEQEILKNE